MQTIAEKLWRHSQAYIGSAREHLNPALLKRKGPVTANTEDERLRISFLFPTLSDKSRTDLLMVREYFLIAREQQERERTDPRDSAQQSEAMAYHAAAQLREALPSFSKVQRQILTRYYLIAGE
jgi:hypothetical protein